MQIMNKTEVKHQVYATHLTASNIPICIQNIQACQTHLLVAVLVVQYQMQVLEQGHETGGIVQVHYAQ